MPKSKLGWLSRAARNDYLNRYYGYEIKPSVPGLGKLIAAVPTAKAAIDRWVHHLPRQQGERKLLDVGCGNGAFLAQMRALGWTCAGIDFDEEAAKVGRQAGLDIRVGALTDETFPEQSFDAVAVCHLIEHVHSPVELVRTCLRLLRPRGLLWIATPNTASLGHKRYGRHWRGLETPRHLVMFNESSLRETLKRAGFRGSVHIGASPPWAPSFYFDASRAIRVGENPHDARPQPLGLRAEAALAKLASTVRPSLGEELIAIVQAP